MKSKDKLLSLLQPKEYKSKIKLYCPFFVADFPKKVNMEHLKDRPMVINICEIETN